MKKTIMCGALAAVFLLAPAVQARDWHRGGGAAQHQVRHYGQPGPMKWGHQNFNHNRHYRPAHWGHQNFHPNRHHRPPQWGHQNFHPNRYHHPPQWGHRNYHRGWQQGRAPWGPPPRQYGGHYPPASWGPHHAPQAQQHQGPGWTQPPSHLIAHGTDSFGQ